MSYLVSFIICAILGGICGAVVFPIFSVEHGFSWINCLFVLIISIMWNAFHQFCLRPKLSVAEQSRQYNEDKQT